MRCAYEIRPPPRPLPSLSFISITTTIIIILFMVLVRERAEIQIQVFCLCLFYCFVKLLGSACSTTFPPYVWRSCWETAFSALFSLFNDVNQPVALCFLRSFHKTPTMCIKVLKRTFELVN